MGGSGGHPLMLFIFRLQMQVLSARTLGSLALCDGMAGLHTHLVLQVDRIQVALLRQIQPSVLVKRPVAFADPLYE